MKTENKFNGLYEKVVNFVDDCECEISVLVTTNRRKNVSSKLANYFATSIIEHQSDEIDNLEIKTRSQRVDIIDNILVEMN